jgi:hypothetical protein
MAVPRPFAALWAGSGFLPKTSLYDTLSAYIIL